ncbi:peptidase M20 [Edaphobacter acidisoli]|uniref:Peptidase M20 n=1 Tax=Edaphobacter acidisoli TaxID=2040573 RepID=A0A916RUK1_9BACT|nr:M20 family metallopeptidase [Edaphobacter acidisoli]GGA70419.1 peptidase M20 [Edaphobacter acidisoli]
MNPQAILGAVEAQRTWMRTTLRALVEQESPSEDRQSVNAAVTLVEDVARPLGFKARRHQHKAFGDVLELNLTPQSRQKPILLLGHLDTVWPLGTLKTMPWREANGRYWGPGVLDMKAGVTMALAAITALKKLKQERNVTLLLNSDEEIGSTFSRLITERLAKKSAAVFVLEPAQGLAYKTARKGVGFYNVEVTGVASHSGVDFERGHSAILELSKQIQTISNFTDLKRNLTVNCGVIAGGTRSNVVAARACTEVDVRIARADDAAHIERLFRKLKPSDPHCKLTITGGINRPPMERKPGTVALFKQARKLAAELGFHLDEAATGGGSDGNFTAALGIPTLDGMGAVGEGAHATHESILIEHLVPRTALLAAMIATID